MTFPGPIFTGAFMFVSLWGAVFMSVLGGLYYNQSVGLFEDLPEEAEGWGHKTWAQRKPGIVDLYNQNAYNAWVCAGALAGIALLLGFRACCLCRG